MATKRPPNVIDHLGELRKRIIICLISLAVLGIGAYCISDSIIEFLTRPIKDAHYNVYFFSPYEAFLIKLKASVLGGIIASIPLIFSQVWLFVSPGLYQREKKMFFPAVISGTFLFLGGVFFCYYYVLPFALRFFLSFQSETLKPLISIKEYVSFSSGLLLSFGIIFNLPIVSAGLTQLGVVNHTFLIKKRKIMLVVVFIVAAVITPPDVFTQIVLALPLIILYEICILISWLLRKKK